MTKFTDLPLIDRLAMALGGGLIVLGTVLLGILELLAGHLSPMFYGYVQGQFGPSMVTALTKAGLPPEATGVVSPLVAPNVRAGIVVAGLLVLALYAVYVVAARAATTTDKERTAPSMAD